ncbi:MAG: nucleotide exchange factor GrpE, partial [Candidatus Ratteibacteria bacterium]|nr:nucleotide exchange factor GrpE [Candidatus Ratteibacteria bacterium]
KDAQISALIKEKEEYIEKWKRALAELENYRKRSEKQCEETRKFALEDILYKLLHILDDFDRALAHMKDAQSLDAIKQGVELIHKELKDLLGQYGVKHIDVVGKEYDPHSHEALEIKHSKEAGDKHTVLEEILPGYILHNRLLRPAKVKISAPPKAEESKEEHKMLKGEKNEEK